MRIRRPDVRLLLLTALATVAMVVVVDHLYVLSQRILPEPDGYLEGLRDLQPRSTGSVLLTAWGLCIMVPIAEEVVFRGLIQRVFARNMGGVIGLVLAGVFFGVIHLNPQLLLSMVVFGIFVGFVFFVTNNLTYTIVSHGIVNSVAFLQLTFMSLDEEMTPPFYMRHAWIFALAVTTAALLAWQIRKEAQQGRAPES
jgi:membrane protease YdiL (CAAX protease family)